MTFNEYLIQDFGPDARDKVVKLLPLVRTTSITKLCTRRNLSDERLENLFAYIEQPMIHKFRNGFVYYFLYDDKPRIVMCLYPSGGNLSLKMINSKDGTNYEDRYSTKGFVYGFELKPLGDFFPKLLSYHTYLCDPLRSYLSCLGDGNVHFQKSPNLKYSDFYKAVPNLKTRMYKIDKIKDLVILSHQLAVLI